MAHGTRDWDPPTVLATLNSIADLGELASRLGSPAHFDRRGEVIRIESFENSGARYSDFANGAGATRGRSLERARSGRWSFKLSPSNDGVSDTGIIQQLADADAGRIGAEISFSTPDTFGELGLSLSYNDGALTQYVTAHFLPATETVHVDAAVIGDVLTGASVRVKNDPDVWYTLKLVADFTTGLPIRLRYNAVEVDLSAGSLNAFAASDTPRLTVLVNLYSRVGHSDVAYLDDLIITQNEP